MDRNKKVILLAGPTSSGKSKLALKLATYLNSEIINADSMQVYKELRILTARPKIKEYQNIRHHLYGFQSVKKNFSTGNWLKLVVKKITDIKKRKKIPILVGGTGLYFKALTDGLVKIPNIPIKFRNRIRSFQKKIGQKNFYKKLIELDPSIKKSIKSTDVQRAIRAYEVKLYTKKSLTDWFKNTKAKFSKDNFFKIYIDVPRPDLIDRISDRSDKMIKQGAIDEVKKFLKLKINKNNSSNKVIGINEIRDLLEKKTDLKEIKEKISIKTRQYAKRQRTWARGQMFDWYKIQSKDLTKFLKKL